MTTVTGNGRRNRSARASRDLNGQGSRLGTALKERPNGPARETGASRGSMGTQQAYDGAAGRRVDNSLTSPAPQKTASKPGKGARAGKASSVRRRMGSKQVVSVRGRRVTDESHRVKRSTVQFVVVVLAIICVGVGITMYFSGLTTQQSFEIQKAKNEKQSLDNELESLNRDVKNASSDAQVAKKASELGMVVPDQPGIITSDGTGGVVENRPADPTKSHKVEDINSGDRSQTTVSSDPNKTNNVSGVTSPPTMTPNQETLQLNNLAPYSPNSNSNGNQAAQPTAANEAPAAPAGQQEGAQ